MIPDGVSGVTALSLLTGGAGLSLLETVHLAEPTVLFVLAVGTTVLLIYAFRLVSPFHEGMEPPRRGVEPPAAIEDGR